MKISTEIASASKLVGEEKAIELYAKAGFDAWDFTLCCMGGYDWGLQTFIPSSHPLAGNEYLSFARKLKQVGIDNGIHCNQSHAPFPVKCPEIRSLCKRAIECTAEAGGEICIIHPDNDKSAEENAEMYFELLPFAKDCGVKIATENMFNWNGKTGDEWRATHAACATPEDFLAHINAVNDDSFVACLDLGHAEIMGEDVSAPQMIRALGSHLQALHIHDNNKITDLHQIPFSGTMDFDPIVKALKEINYSGYFTLEADKHLHSFTDENICDGINELAAAAKKLVTMFENY